MKIIYNSISVCLKAFCCHVRLQIAFHFSFIDIFSHVMFHFIKQIQTPDKDNQSKNSCKGFFHLFKWKREKLSKTDVPDVKM